GHVERGSCEATCFMLRTARMLEPGAEIHQDYSPTVAPLDVVRLDLSMRKPRSIHRRQGSTDVTPNQRRFARSKRAALAHQFFEGAAMNELHPESPMSRYSVCAVDRHHVRMTDLRQHPTFVNHDRHITRIRRVPPAQQLHRHFTIERRLPPSINRPDRPFANFLHQTEGTPGLQGLFGRTDVSGALLLPADNVSSL